MLKKLGVPMIALAGMLAFALPPKADARIHFGIGIGGPVYTAPVPAYPYDYSYPYGAYGNYYAPPVYSYPYVAPGYGYVPYGGFSLGFGSGWGHERYEHEGHFEGGHYGGGHFEGHGGGHFRGGHGGRR